MSHHNTTMLVSFKLAIDIAEYKIEEYKVKLLSNDGRESFYGRAITIGNIIKNMYIAFDTKAFDKLYELNKKHGYDSSSDNCSITERFNKVKEKREVNEIKIEKEIFIDTKDFNSRFEHNKTDGKYKSQIIEYSGMPSELSTYVVGEHYTSLGDIDKLYIEDSVQSSKYSSLDRAFSLQPVLKPSNNSTYDDRMKEYQKETKYFNSMKQTDFSSKKFNEL
jgi:hypothetical protein